MKWLKTYEDEERRYPALSRARCSSTEVEHVWPDLCRHFRLHPRLVFTRGNRYSKGCRDYVKFNVHGPLTWLLVAHEFAHAVAGVRENRWHHDDHKSTEAKIAAFIRARHWHRGAVRQRIRRLHGKKSRSCHLSIPDGAISSGGWRGARVATLERRNPATRHR